MPPHSQRERAICPTHWPYGASCAGDNETQRRLIAWAEKHGLRYSEHGHCLHWLTTGQCRHDLCRAGHGAFQWMDHVTGWTKGGKPSLLLAQPYHLWDFASLEKVAKEYGIHITVDGRGWYGHGTIAILMTVGEVCDADE